MEIEIKCYCDNDNNVKKKLTEIGAQFIDRRFENDIYFNHPSKNFADTDEALRLRTIGERTIITYKGPKVSKISKARIEYETEVEDYPSMKNILLKLGFVESGIVEKERHRYSFNGMEISIDYVEGLGTFVEIEKIGELKEEAEKELFNTAERLGLNNFERRSYLELKYFS
ncbi:MAG: class IV adenylate cyclase [Spirochaetes bacterium]|nr:class IV adenylate cyclase [Spirochaetota bacterium]